MHLQLCTISHSGATLFFCWELLLQNKPILYSFATLASGSWVLSGLNVGYTEPYYFLGCGLAGAHLLRQIQTADLDDSKSLADRFKSNNQVGGILFMSCVVGNYMV